MKIILPVSEPFAQSSRQRDDDDNDDDDDDDDNKNNAILSRDQFIDGSCVSGVGRYSSENRQQCFCIMLSRKLNAVTEIRAIRTG